MMVDSPVFAMGRPHVGPAIASGFGLNDAAEGRNQNVGQVFNLSGQDAILSCEMRAKQQQSAK
jgi:hypothetical protein